MIRRTLAAVTLLLVATVALLAVGGPGEGSRPAGPAPADACRQAGTDVATEHAREAGSGEAEPAGEAAPGPQSEATKEADRQGENEAQQERAKVELAARCGIKVPESFQELSAANQALSPRLGIDFGRRGEGDLGAAHPGAAQARHHQGTLDPDRQRTAALRRPEVPGDVRKRLR